MRISKTEFISCPSCGRTLFNLSSSPGSVLGADRTDAKRVEKWDYRLCMLIIHGGMGPKQGRKLGDTHTHTSWVFAARTLEHQNNFDIFFLPDET